MKCSRFIPALATTVAVLMLAAATPAHAQTRWNRRVEAISVTPAPVDGGLQEIVVYYSVHALEPSAPLDLGTGMDILVNGTVVSSQVFPVVAHPGTFSGCGGFCLSNQACFCCEVNGEAVCGCGSWIAPGSAVPVVLRPEDYIEVILYPAPGALPEEDTSDDRHDIVYQDQPLIWNRRIASLDVVQSPVGNGFFDVTADVDLQISNEGSLRLDAELDLFVNGEPLASIPADIPLWEGGQCVDECGGEPCGNFGGCTPFTKEGGCGCTFELSYTFPSVPGRPGDVITVILRPVPEALPELPGFDEDDAGSARICPADVDQNGFVDFGDILAILGAWGPCAGCPEDLDQSGVVDFADLLVVLAAWGPCEPV